MEEVAGTAKLVDPDALGADRALTATLPRSNLEAALQDEAGADLYLEIARIQDGERNDRRIRVEWEHDDLAQLLDGSSGDPVSITLDAEELVRMLDDPDFEAHGLKETMATIAVALGGAAALTGGAAAVTESDGGGTAAPAAVVGMVTDSTSAGQPGAITGLATDASTSGQSGYSFPSFTVRSGGDAAQTPTAEPSGGGGFSVPDSALGGIALAGGIALLITGAAVAGRSRRGGALPA
jgi:hypothetical protein